MELWCWKDTRRCQLRYRLLSWQELTFESSSASELHCNMLSRRWQIKAAVLPNDFPFDTEIEHILILFTFFLSKIPLLSPGLGFQSSCCPGARARSSMMSFERNLAASGGRRTTYRVKGPRDAQKNLIANNISFFLISLTASEPSYAGRYVLQSLDLWDREMISKWSEVKAEHSFLSC